MTATLPLQFDPAAAEVRVLRGGDALDVLDSRWDDLVLRQPVPNPTLTSTWLRKAAEWEPGEPLLLVAEHGGCLVAAGAFGLRRRLRVRTVATWLGADAQWFSPDLLVDPAFPDAGRALIEAVLGLADRLDLPVAACGPAYRALSELAPWRLERPRGEGWLLPLPPPRLAYAEGRANYVRRRAARLGAEVRIVVADEPDGLRDALERLVVLHRSQWDERSGEIPRFSTTQAHRDWYRELVAAMAVEGAARIVEIYEDDRLVAGTLGFVRGRGAVYHTTASAKDANLLEAGHVALLELVASLQAAGAEFVDLGLGAGAPGTPKARLGPERLVWTQVTASASRLEQRLVRVNCIVDAAGRTPMKFVRSVARRGLVGTCREVATRIHRSRIGRLHHYLAELAFDRVHGVRTRGIVRHEKVGRFEQAFRYEATPPRVVRRILRRLPTPLERFAFIDVGCGRGLVLLVASEFPFRRLVGIELSEPLAVEARANLSTARRSRPAPEWELVGCDATDYELPPEPAVLFLFNPFSRVKMQAFLARLERSLAAHPRDAIVILISPEAREVFDRSESFREIASGRRYVVYRASTPSITPRTSAPLRARASPTSRPGRARTHRRRSQS